MEKKELLYSLSRFECFVCSSNIECFDYYYDVLRAESIFYFKCHEFSVDLSIPDMCVDLNTPNRYVCMSNVPHFFHIKRIVQAYFLQVTYKNTALRIKAEDWVLLQSFNKYQTRSWVFNELWQQSRNMIDLSVKDAMPVQEQRDIDRVKTQRLLELRGYEKYILGDWEPECINDKNETLSDRKETRDIKKANKRLILF